MNAKKQAAYDTGMDEALNYGARASFEDFCIYIGDDEDYEAYQDGYEYGHTLMVGETE
jgi:hypothetical protein